MENIKKDEWLHEEFGIKVDNKYLCIRKNEDRIVGQILNFSPRSNIAIKCEDGLHIIPYKEILELRPLPIKEERFKVGDILEVKKEFFTPVYGDNCIYTRLLRKETKLLIKNIHKTELEVLDWKIGTSIWVKIDVVKDNCKVISTC
ncbi:hypothetical protein QTH47_12790 [Clostridium perfringens]|nr:hypothetical protein [Clostridium perfringens]